MIRLIFRMMSFFLTFRAASRGPEALGKRMVRRAVWRGVGKSMRRWGL